MVGRLVGREQGIDKEHDWSKRVRSGAETMACIPREERKRERDMGSGRSLLIRRKKTREEERGRGEKSL